VRGDVQAPDAARGTGIAVKGRRRRRFRGGFWRRRRGREGGTDQLQTARPAAVRQEAEVTDPHEAFGQHMHRGWGHIEDGVHRAMGSGLDLCLAVTPVQKPQGQRAMGSNERWGQVLTYASQ